MAISFQRFTNLDLKIIACTTYAHNDHNYQSLKTAELQSVEKSFRFNISRIRLMMLLPAHLCDIATRGQHLMDIAELEITGGLGDIELNFPRDILEKIISRFQELFAADLEKRSAARNDPSWHASALESIKVSTVPAEILASVPALSGGMQALLASYLTSTWTTFETLCGDLWESAVNIYPDRLAHLRGDTKQFLKGREARDNNSSARNNHSDSKKVSLATIQKHEFDTRNKMGTILREDRFEFSRLKEIREAYGLAFDSDYKEIGEALTDQSIDALHTIRNTIVHKAAIADERYTQLQRTLKLPAAKTGYAINLDGESVVEMISPVIECSKKLLYGVDHWLAKHRPNANPPDG